MDSISPRLFGAFGFLGLLVCVTSMAGCSGSSLDRVNVQGTVTYKSKPVGSGRIRFFNSKNEEVRTGNLKGDGTFALTDIPRGEVKVTVENTAESKMPAASKAPKDTPVIPGATPEGTGPVVPIPAKYKKVESSGLVFPITQQDQKLEIRLE